MARIGSDLPRHDMAQIIGYNDGYFSEPALRVLRFSRCSMRQRYMTGWWGGRVARWQAIHNKILRKSGLK